MPELDFAGTDATTGTNGNSKPRDQQQKTIDRIAKLLRQSADARNRGDVEEETAYQVMAFELMAKHGIDEAMARAHADGLDKKVDPKAEFIYVRMEGKYKPLQMDCYYHLAGAMHCAAFTTTGRRATVRGHDVGVALKIYGMKDHLERLQIMWSLLQPQLMHGMSHAKPEYDLADSGKLRVYRRNWGRGFIDAVSERIQKAEYDAASGAGALVLYRKDLEIADRQMRTDHRISSGRATYRSNSSAYSTGHKAGSRASLHRELG